MEYVEAVSQFIERHYKEKDIHHIEIDFWGNKNHLHSLYIYKHSNKIKYDHFFFDLLDYYSQLKQEQDKRASKKVLQLGNTFLRCFLI